MEKRTSWHDPLTNNPTDEQLIVPISWWWASQFTGFLSWQFNSEGWQTPCAPICWNMLELKCEVKRTGSRVCSLEIKAEGFWFSITTRSPSAVIALKRMDMGEYWTSTWTVWKCQWVTVSEVYRLSEVHRLIISDTPSTIIFFWSLY